MSRTSDQPAAQPVFKKCARCEYSLRGLPGRHPFMRWSGGVYHPSERSISVGGVVGDELIRAGAHELAHWLDASYRPRTPRSLGGAEVQSSDRSTSSDTLAHDPPLSARWLRCMIYVYRRPGGPGRLRMRASSGP